MPVSKKEVLNALLSDIKKKPKIFMSKKKKYRPNDNEY